MSSGSSGDEQFPLKKAKVAATDNNSTSFALSSNPNPKDDDHIYKRQMCERQQTPIQMKKLKPFHDELDACNKEAKITHCNCTEAATEPSVKKDHSGTKQDVNVEGSTDFMTENTKHFVHDGVGVDIIETSFHSIYTREVSNSSSDETAIRPGAVAVAGPGITSAVEQNNFAEILGIANEIQYSPGNSNNMSVLKLSAFVVQSITGKNKLPSARTSGEDRYGPVIDGAVVQDTPQKDTNQTGRGHCIALLAALIVMAAICIAVTLSLTLIKSNTSKSTKNVGSPSHQHSVMPSASPASPRVQLITSTLNSLGISNFASPSQQKAVVWLADDDPAQIEVDDISNLTERYALATIYFALGGDSTWINQLNFLSPDSICNWNVLVPGFNSTYRVDDGNFEIESQYDWFVIGRKGVFCDKETGMVNGIGLATNNVTGTLPDEIGLLKQLRHISLWQNQIRGSIPSSFYGLDQIENIFFLENQITGIISSEVGKMRNIAFLGVAANNLTGSIPESIGELALLTRLVASLNFLTGTIPSEINKLFNLEYIFLDNNFLNGSIPLNDGTYSELKYLFLHNNKLVGTIPETIYTHINMMGVRLMGNSLIGTISENISNLISLFALDLGSNRLDGNIPHSIGSNSKLEYLRLHGNRFTGTLPDTLGSLASLRELSVHNNRLSGTIPVMVAQTPYLVALFHGNNFNGSLDFLCDQKPHFVSADCYGNNPKVLCKCCDSCCRDGDGCYGLGGCTYTSDFLCH